MSDGPRRAVVFAYHSVGVRALAVLASLGVDVPLVLTHDDDPQENQWFDSVRELANWQGIPVITPEDPNRADVVQRVRDLQPDWLFSFYYRRMLGAELLGVPANGAYNLHGSLLPRYRGRVPINWAVLNGEQETGASLHRMVEKPDAGALVDQERVAILPNDTAHAVFRKVVCASERLLLRAVPEMLAGRHREQSLDLAAGSYFGGRRPEDGRIDWGRPAAEIHNLIRAVAPPYPGAFGETGRGRIEVLGSWYRGEAAQGAHVCLYWQGDACFLDCSDGKRLRLTALASEGRGLTRADFIGRFGSDRLLLGESA